MALLGLAVLLAVGCGGGQPPWVVLVVMDAVRADHLGFHGYERDTSPFLDGWVEEAAIFERAHTPAPWTLPAFGSLYTGAVPSSHGAGVKVTEEDVGSVSLRSSRYTFRKLRRQWPTLAERLGERGYCTAAFVNNIFLDRRFGMARGFDVYDHVPGSDSSIRRADETVDSTLSWLDGPGNECEAGFVIVHMFDPHHHYDAPKPVRGKFTREVAGAEYGDGIESRIRAARAGDMEFLEAAYDEEIAFVDREFGRLVTEVERRLGRHPVLWVVTSDHGEAFGDHGRTGHGNSLYQELLHVPLVFRGPDVSAGRYPEPVSLVDVAPTILEMTGGREDESARRARGQSLWPALADGGETERRFIFAEAILHGPERKALIRWPLKLIFNPETGSRRLFDLADDPEERDDRASAESPELYELLRELQALERDAATEGAPVPLDDETLRQLEALGYVR